MYRMEQGVPLEVLDLRSCYATSLAVQLLSEIVVDVWAPKELQIVEGCTDLTWHGARGPFAPDDDSSKEGYYEDYICY